MIILVELVIKTVKNVQVVQLQMSIDQTLLIVTVQPVFMKQDQNVHVINI